MAFNKENMNALNINIQSNDTRWRRTLYLGLIKSGARWGLRLLSMREKLENSVGKEDVDVEKSDGNSYIKDLKESHLVVSALIATVTFAAGIAMPGGYQSGEQHPGSAVLSGNLAFEAFVIADTVAFSLSTCAIMIQFYTSLKRKGTALNVPSTSFGGAVTLTLYAMVAMVVAFVTGTFAVLEGPSPGFAYISSALGFCYFFGSLGFPPYAKWGQRLDD